MTFAPPLAAVCLALLLIFCGWASAFGQKLKEGDPAASNAATPKSELDEPLEPPSSNEVQDSNTIQEDIKNLEPRIAKKHPSKPFVVVTGLLEGAKGDVVCFVAKKDKKIACGKVAAAKAERLLVKVRPALLPKLKVGMEAILKKSRKARRKKPKKPKISKEKKNFKEGSFDYSVTVGAGGRYYPTPPLQDNQADGLGYVFLEPELNFATKDQDHLFKLRPFYRYDFVDDKRTLGDLKELEYIGVKDSFEWRLGIRKVFWGVTESVHLVDIINQTDFAADIDGEEKLGQPMINLAMIQDSFTFDIFLMSFFRERSFPGPKGRLRPPFRIFTSGTTFESKAKKNQLDAAARLGVLLDGIDIGLSYFNGTGREPIYRQGIDESNNLVLIPRYILIEQLGLDVQWAINQVVLKLEGISNQNKEEDYTAYAVGIDYARYGVFASPYDLTFIFEYMQDSRENEGFLPLFQNDLFFGTRLNFNDVGLSSLLFGQYYDLEYGSLFSTVELVKRFDSAPIRLTLDIRGIANTDDEEPLHFLRRDSHINLELAYIF